MLEKKQSGIQNLVCCGTEKQDLTSAEVYITRQTSPRNPNKAPPVVT